MNKIRFIGESDHNFIYGETYEIVKINYEKGYYFYTEIINKYHIARRIPYSSIYTFLENWEIVNERIMRNPCDIPRQIVIKKIKEKAKELAKVEQMPASANRYDTIQKLCFQIDTLQELLEE